MIKNKKKLIIGIVIALFVAAVAVAFIWFSRADEAAGFHTVSPRAAQELIKNKQGLMIIDVRGPEELREGWIEGSVFMPLPDILNGKLIPPKDRPILLVCAVGGRSLGLGKAMVNYGWPEVYNLESGIAEWKRQGLPLKNYQ